MTVLEKIFLASKNLFNQAPFYGILSLRVRKVLDASVPTACIGLASDNFSMEIKFNPEWTDCLTVDEVQGLIEHELNHMINGHLTDPIYTADHVQHELMNIAMDCEINQYINSKYLPKEGVTLQGLSNKVGISLPEKAGTMTYYDVLLKQYGQNKISIVMNGDGTATVMVNGQPIKTVDVHTIAKSSASTQAAIEGIVENAANETIKRRGTLPANVTSMLEKLQEKRKPSVDWKMFLRRFVSHSYKEHTITTRRRESRRFDDAPGLRHEPEFKLLVGIDTSGSVSDKELKEFMQEIDNISKQKCDIKILLCDTKIHKEIDYVHGTKTDFEVVGRGGTNFEPVLEYYRTHPDTCLVYFTDGECLVESKLTKPVLWIISSIGTTNWLKDYKYIQMQK